MVTYLICFVTCKRLSYANKEIIPEKNKLKKIFLAMKIDEFT
jgi:hypothetical protein